MERRIDAVRAALALRGDRAPADVDRRVAASLTHGGLVSRLVSPVLGCAVVCDHALDVSLRDLWWQDRLGGPFPLSVPASPRPRHGSFADALMPVVAAITAAVESVVDVSALVLAGNVAAAINSAALTIAARDLDLADRSFALADELLTDPALESEPGPCGPQFVRNSCCLAYQLNPATRELCGDCVLR